MAGDERYVVTIQLLRSVCQTWLPVYVPNRENPIVNRLNKTKVEREVDHEQERQERIKRENAVKRAAAVAQVCSVVPS